MKVVYPDHPKKANGISFVGKTRDGRPCLYATHRLKDNKMITFGIENVQDFEPGTKLFIYLSIPGFHSRIESCAKHKDQYPNDIDLMTVYYKDKISQEFVEMEGKFGFLVPLDTGTGDPER